MSTNRRRTYLELLGGLDMRLLGSFNFTSSGVAETSFTPSGTGSILVMSLGGVETPERNASLGDYLKYTGAYAVVINGSGIIDFAYVANSSTMYRVTFNASAGSILTTAMERNGRSAYVGMHVDTHYIFEIEDAR